MEFFVFTDKIEFGLEVFEANKSPVRGMIEEGSQTLLVLGVTPEALNDEVAMAFAAEAKANGYASIGVSGVDPSQVRRSVLDLRQAGLAAAAATRKGAAEMLAALASRSENQAAGRTLDFACRKVREVKSTEALASVDIATDMAFAAMPVLRFADRANHWLNRPERPAAFEQELARQLLNIRAEASAPATAKQA